jgi:hypothetical protein
LWRSHAETPKRNAIYYSMSLPEHEPSGRLD